MQRLVLYLSSAAAVALAVWLVWGAPDPQRLDRPGYTGEPTAGAVESASPDAARPGSGSGGTSSRASSPMGNAPAGGQPSARDRSGATPDAFAGFASSDSRALRPLGEAPSDPEAPGSTPQVAGGIPLGGVEQAPAGPGADSSPREALSGERPAASESPTGGLPVANDGDAATTPEPSGTESGDGLSPEEIEARAEQLVPDDAAPLDQLGPLRARVADDLATKSGQSADLAN